MRLPSLLFVLTLAIAATLAWIVFGIDPVAASTTSGWIFRTRSAVTSVLRRTSAPDADACSGCL